MVLDRAGARAEDVEQSPVVNIAILTADLLAVLNEGDGDHPCMSMKLMVTRCMGEMLPERRAKIKRKPRMLHQAADGAERLAG